MRMTRKSLAMDINILRGFPPAAERNKTAGASAGLPVDQEGDFGAKCRLNIFQGSIGVLDHIMEQPGNHSFHILLNIGENSATARGWEI